jgi:hypothetical protein
MDFMQFIIQEGLIIAAGLYVIGVIIKGIPNIPNWIIPFVLVALGVLAAGFSMDGGFTIANILQGIFAAGAAVLVNQGIKQASERDGDE